MDDLGGNPPFKETSLSGYQGWHILVAQTGYTEHRIDLPFPGAKRFMQPKKLPWFEERLNRVDPYWGSSKSFIC